jgi:hypothetical protein
MQANFPDYLVLAQPIFLASLGAIDRPCAAPAVPVRAFGRLAAIQVAAAGRAHQRASCRRNTDESFSAAWLFS